MKSHYFSPSGEGQSVLHIHREIDVWKKNLGKYEDWDKQNKICQESQNSRWKISINKIDFRFLGVLKEILELRNLGMILMAYKDFLELYDWNNSPSVIFTEKRPEAKQKNHISQHLKETTTMEK